MNIAPMDLDEHASLRWNQTLVEALIGKRPSIKETSLRWSVTFGGNFLGPGAQERTRTSTVLPPLGPEPSASTNFATWADGSAAF